MEGGCYFSDALNEHREKLLCCVKIEPNLLITSGKFPEASRGVPLL